jgi:hypothetical protein
MSEDPRDGDPSDDDPSDADSSNVDSPGVADAVFRVLSDEHRRCALYYLLERESTTVEELATVVTGWMQARDDEIEIATLDDRDRVRIKLHHVHLPRIADERFVRYDYDSGAVALDDAPELLETLLERSLAHERHRNENRPESGTDRRHSEDG